MRSLAEPGGGRDNADSSHRSFYVRITATGPIRDALQHVENSSGGVHRMIAVAIYGQVLEYTEGPPGLEPGRAWVFVLFSDVPIRIQDVLTDEGNPFDDVGYRGWVAQVERVLTSGPGNAVTISDGDRAWAARAVAEGRLKRTEFADTLRLP